MFGWIRSLFAGPSRRALTRESMARLSDRKLVYKAIYSLPDAERANTSQWLLVYAFELDGEVRNGGFNQYYHNAAEHCRQAAEAFATMGAEDLSDLVNRANACFDANRQRLEALWSGSRKGLAQSYRLDCFGEFDRAYYQSVKRERFYALAARFVREHADDFLSET